jgi:negative regulator of replication initiation
MTDEKPKKLDTKRKQLLKSKLLEYARKAQSTLVAEALAKKNKTIEERLPILPELKSLEEDAIRQLCRELHGKLIIL